MKIPLDIYVGETGPYDGACEIVLDDLFIIAEQYDAKFWDKMDRIVRRAVKNGALVNKRGTLKCVVPVYK